MTNNTKIIGTFAILLTGFAVYYTATSRFQIVSLSAEKFECTATMAVGINAECRQFTMKPAYTLKANKPQD